MKFIEAGFDYATEKGGLIYFGSANSKEYISSVKSCYSLSELTYRFGTLKTGERTE